jgi:hypothetical protein
MPNKDKKNILVSAAKTIGTIAGKVASVANGDAGPGLDAASSKATKKGKLLPKNKARLPRREKKAQRKSETARH